MSRRREYVRLRTGRRASSLRAVYVECTAAERRLCAPYFELYPRGEGTGGLTPFEGIGEARPWPAAVSRAALRDELTEAIARSLPAGTEVSIAVGGGVDSWLLAQLLKSLGYTVRAWYLRSDVEGYCELQQVERISRDLGFTLQTIQVATSDFVDALPRFVEVTECPVYNLHPVSKLLLAEHLRRRGVTRIVTGDGADQVMRRLPPDDLLPLTLACFESAGVDLMAPFLNVTGGDYPNKEPVRALARRLGVPDIPKRPTMFPATPLPDEPRADVSPNECLCYTAGLLLHVMEAHRQCAASPA
jgi:asparagine synthase (glutamine-hydrolysing)